MAYCTKEQVAEEFVGVVFDADSKILATTVDRWIEEADELINAMVGLRYVTPITGPISLIIMRKISLMLVSWRVARTKQVKTPVITLDQGDTPQDSKDGALSILAKIIEGKMNLSDATLLSSSDGVRSFNFDNGIEHFFKRGVDQW